MLRFPILTRAENVIKDIGFTVVPSHLSSAITSTPTRSL